MKIPNVDFWPPHIQKSRNFMPVIYQKEQKALNLAGVQGSTKEYTCNDLLFARVIRQDLAIQSLALATGTNDAILPRKMTSMD